MRREKLEHLVTIGMMEGKRSRGKQRENMLDGLTNNYWLKIGIVSEALKAMRGIKMSGRLGQSCAYILQKKKTPRTMKFSKLKKLHLNCTF